MAGKGILSTRALEIVTMAFLLLLRMVGASHGKLQSGFYSHSCPDAERIVTAVVQTAAASDATILPALVRLQFHDCFVRGCDASVLITSTGNAAEVNNDKHQGLRGQDVVYAAKAELEEQCPGVVSCADIIALASRDAIAMTNGPLFPVPTGRRDGLSSNLLDADILPDVSDSIQVLRSKFAANGLNDSDLVLLTAAHTIGTTACFFVSDRLYSYGGGLGSDPSIPAAFLSELTALCMPGDLNARVPLDRGSEGIFDDSILRNIRAGLVPIASDAALDTTNVTGALIDAYLGAASSSFAQDFVGAMLKMGTIGVVTGNGGEVRDVCTAFNAKDEMGSLQHFAPTPQPMGSLQHFGPTPQPGPGPREADLTNAGSEPCSSPCLILCIASLALWLPAILVSG